MADYSKQIGYDAYLRYIHPFEGISGGGDAGFTQGGTGAPLYTEDAWNALPPATRYNLLLSGGVGLPGFEQGQGIGHGLDVDPADAAAFRAKFGANNFDHSNGDNIVATYGGPLGQYGMTWNQYAIDPSRVYTDPNGVTFYEASNIDSEKLRNAQHAANGSWRSFWQNGLPLVAGLILGGYAGGAFGAAGEAGVAATDAAESGGTLALNAAGTGTSAYVPTAGAVAEGGLGAGTAGYDASGGGLLNSGLSGGEGGSGGLLGGSGGMQTLDPITLQSVPEVNAGGMATYNGSPWYQSLLDNPMGTARTVSGLYSMGSSLANRNQHVTAGHPQYAGGGVAQGVPTLNIGGGNGGPGGQSGFQQNPYLLMQMNSVPFMRGANGLLGL